MSTEQIVEQTPYGTNEIGFPFHAGHGGYQRVDTYRSNSDPRPTNERRFALNAADRSPMARPMYADQGNCHYHANCSCCWLGFSHTLALHENQAH